MAESATNTIKPAAATAAAAAAKHGITFPVVVAAEKNWDNAYNVKGVSRTIYYAQKNRIAWTSVGLNDKSAEELQANVKRDLAG
mgnify:CR=1 FL=1